MDAFGFRVSESVPMPRAAVDAACSVQLRRRRRSSLGSATLPGALQRHDAVGPDHLLEIVHLLRRTIEADGQLVRADAENTTLEHADQLDDLASDLRAGRHGGQQQLALHRIAGSQLGDLDHVDQLVELLDDLLERGRLDVDDHGDPTEPLVVGGGHRQRHDVEPATGEQPRHPGEHTRLVLDEHGEDVVLGRRHGQRPPWPWRRVDDDLAVGPARTGPSGTPSRGRRCGSR